MAEIYVSQNNINKPQSQQSQDPALEGVDLSKALTGEEVSELIKLRTAGQIDYNPTHEDYLAYNEWNKNRHINVMDGLMEGGSAVLGDLGRAVGQVFTHPIDSTAKFAPSVLEAFMQGSRNLYGMVAQSADPNSTLFKWKNALSHDGSVDGYNQFLDALDFNKRSAELASGKDTILVNKDYIDHDITLAASYIADPTLFIPFGTVASAGLKAAGLGERVAMIGARVEAMKGALIGGGLKMAGGAIEVVGGATRATMDGALKVGGNVLETATGMSSKEWQATARMSGMTGSVANMMGADIAGVSGLSGAYVASGAARGVGEAMGAVGEQMLKQGGKRGFNSFAVEALKNTPNLSPHAQKLLKVLDSVDPMLSYADTIGTGMAHGAVIGGGLGYLSAGEEGAYHGMGAGIALGGVGAGLGRMYADYTGGTMYQRAEVQGTFVMENWKKTSPEKYAFGEKLLADATATGDRAGALQILAGLDKVAPDARFFAGGTTELTAFLKSKGYDLQGFKIDPQTGARIKDANGKEIQVNKDATDLKYTEGGVFTMHIDKVNGKKQTTMFINTDHSVNTTYHHELFHTVFRETVMKDFFKDKLASKLLGEYENGVKVKNGEVHPKEFRAFAERYNRSLHKKNGVLDKVAFDEAMKQFDSSIAEWNRAKKLGKDAVMGADGNTQAGKAAEHLEYMVEEFGAYYFTQMMKGKPLDYLFKGADLGGIRGAFESIHNSFLDFFEGRARKANPQGAGRFDFSKGLDKGFGEATGSTQMAVDPLTGKTIAKAGDGTGVTGQGVGVTGTSTKRVRVGGIDYLMRDLIRATASQSKGSVGGVDVRTWTPEARTAFFEGRGADGLKFQFDKNGNRLTDSEEKQLRKEHGKLIFDALSTLDPNLVKDGVIAGTLSDAHIQHLIDKGLISKELGNRIKNIQRMVNDPTVPNVVSHDYSGNTKELEGDVNNPARLRKDKGDYVPLTNRESIIFDYRFSVDKEGNTIMIAESLDKQVLDFRGNKQWAKPEVRQLFGDNRDAFDKAFIEYIRNANKDASDPTRVESAKLPLLEVGDGLGEKRRDIMHQVAGFAKAKGSDYINPPLAEIKRNTRSTRQSLRVDLMSDVKAQSTTRFEFNDKNAFKDLSRNFKPSEMDSETTPNGTVYKHPNGSSLLKSNDGLYNVYDSRNKLIGKYRTEAEASKSLEYNFNKEEQRSQRNIETGIKTQQKVQGSFKVIDVATRKEAEKTGNIFTTQWGKEFTAGTKVVPQTREEFMASSMIKLRQAKPEVIRQVVEAKVAEVQGMRQRLEQIKLEYKAEWNRNGMESTKTKALAKEANFLQARVQKYSTLEFAVQQDKSQGSNGTHILQVINNLRENGGVYKDISKMLFGDAYDKQFRTGEPVTTVATHGTTSDALIKAMEFDINRLGETHGSESDKVGAFLSGSTSTSEQYSYGKEGIGRKMQPMRQVRALVKMENPYVVDLNYKSFDSKLYDGHFKLAKQGGHDGVIFQNVYDGGGAADSVFIPFAEKLAQNTAILDTVKTDVGTFENKGYSPAQRQSVGRGTTTLSDLVKGSFKVRDVVRETGFDKFIDNARLSGRLIEGRSSTDFAGRPVVIINYDNSGVWRLTDSVTGETIGEIDGGAMHNIISGKINPDKQSAVLASVNDAGLEAIEKVRQKALDKGVPLTFVINSGSLQKSLSHPQVANTVTGFLARFLHQGVIDAKDLNNIIKDMSEAYVEKKINDETVRIATGVKLKHLIDKSPQEQISFLQNEFLKQDKSTFNERSSTMERLTMALGGLESVRNNKDYFRKFFGNEKFNPSGKGFKNELLKLTDDPITRDAKGESIGYGKAVAVLEVPNNQSIVSKTGGHEAFPVDYRSDKGKGKSTPAVMSILDQPVRIVDMFNPPYNKDIGTHYISKSGKVRPTTEMLMNSTSTFGEAVVKEGSHEVRPDTPPEKRLTKEQIQTGNFKPSDYSSEQAYNARENQPMKLWSYPNTDNFIKWTGNLPKIDSLSSLSNSRSLENGFVTTVFKGVSNRDFDSFENRNLNLNGEPKDKYGRILKKGDKDPNYFIPEYKPASIYATDVIGYKEKYPKMYERMKKEKALSEGKPDMYYIKSENPAVFTDITKDSKVYSDLYNWWKENIKDEYASNYIKDNPKKYSKLVDFNFDAFVEMINKGEFREDKHWQENESGVNWWQDFAKDFLNKGYDSVVIKDTTVHKSTPTIIIDQGTTNVKASSNYGDFSSSDKRFNFKPSEQAMKSEFIGKQAEQNPSKLNGMNLSFIENKKLIYGENNVTLVINQPEARGQRGEQIGIIMAKIYDDGTAKILDTNVNPYFQKKGYGTILYSELAERFRHMGVKEIVGEITNEDGVPQKIREKVIGNERTDYDSPSNISESGYKTVSTLDANGRYKVSEQVKKGVSDIDTTIAGISKRSVVSSGILSALDDFKEALRKQDATDEVVVKEVEETHTALLNAINDEMSASSEASLPDLRKIKKKVESIDRGLKKNQGRIGEKIKKNYQSEMDEGADIESQQAIRAKNEVESDMETGADIESEQAFDKTQERVAQHEADMAEGADIEGEQAFDSREEASAEAERQSNAQAQAQTQAGNAQAQGQPQPTPQPKVTNERDSWRLYATERTPNGSISKNAKGFSIILNGTKLRVYNPQNVLLGIYTDLEQAKRRVQREEPKPR